jgi:hypothetical protein
MRNVQIPDDLYRRAAELAEQDHVSVDRVVTALVSEGVSDWDRVRSRAERGSLEELKRVLDRVPDLPATPEDQP